VLKAQVRACDDETGLFPKEVYSVQTAAWKPVLKSTGKDHLLYDLWLPILGTQPLLPYEIVA
jgi:hypothetical protein